ncbi:TPA: hypothetical protein R4K21_003188 [Stenotrophomonas maltophilia]|nr:hypothetical protein [Stenotrophomonas maltophilia]
MNLEQIDTSTTAGKAEVMRLAAEGRRVAQRENDEDFSVWGASVNPLWDWSFYDYAIISEPVGPEEVWGVVFDKHTGLWDEKEAAAKTAEATGYRLVRYIRADLAGDGK